MQVGGGQHFVVLNSRDLGRSRRPGGEANLPGFESIALWKRNNDVICS